MKHKHTKPIAEHDKLEPTPSNGKDEMNLAEFPFASLRRHGDTRRTITYEGWTVDKEGTRRHQKWTVAGSTAVGLPTEFDERVLVALITITDGLDFVSRKIPFSVYQVIKIIGLVRSKLAYQSIEDSLDRLVGVTIKSEQAFWDNSRKERVTTKEAFHIVEKYWLRYREQDAKIIEAEGVPGYIIWGEDIWNSFKANYIKSLDLTFFYGLQSPAARRLYRFLDKRMQYQQQYEIDIIELAKRLGMTVYRYPAKVREKLQPALDELIARGFLRSAKVFKHNANGKLYTRIRFVKAPKAVPQPAEPYNDGDEETATYQDRYTVQLNALRKHYGITDDLVDIWEQALIEIEGATTRANFHAWFPQTHLLSCKQNAAIIGVPNTYAQEWLAGRMTPVIKRALEGAAGHPVERLYFQVVTLPKTEG
ncbi:MAG: hypothetical protein DCC55_35845 [Chloroflexi bacterium]|nr:MAG: hypothetical protein DCC55_35845 [Chloroflexota bacterium]